MISTTPYLMRAIYDWCSDQGFTPHLLVDASIEGVVVPQQLVENDTIVLNIKSTAVRSLDLGNEWLMFNARFSGKPMEVIVPIKAVRAIFARENGLGCAFEVAAEPTGDAPAESAPETLAVDTKKPVSKSNAGKAKDPKSHLKLV
jgi:stringent starvation protein B